MVRTAFRLSLCSLALATSVHAGDSMPTPTSVDDTSLFVGLNWSFGATSGLQGQIGVIHAEIDPDGDLTGARLTLSFGLDGTYDPSIALSGFTGEDDTALEIGLGFGPSTGVYGMGGVLANYLAVGGTYGAGGAGGYAGVHSYEFPNAQVQVQDMYQYDYPD